MHQQLPVVERTQIAWRGVTQADDAEKGVARRIRDRDGVRELLCRVDAVMMADRHVRRGRRIGGLASPRRLDGRERRSGQHYAYEEGASHFRAPGVCAPGV